MSAVLRATPIASAGLVPAAVTLAHVLDRTGSEFEVAVAPRGLDQPVRQLIIDPWEGSCGEGDVVVVTSSSPVVLAGTVALAGARGASAVVTQQGVAGDEAAQLARQSGVALLITRDLAGSVAAVHDVLAGSRGPRCCAPFSAGRPAADDRDRRLRLLLEGKMPADAAWRSRQRAGAGFAVLGITGSADCIQQVLRDAERHRAEPLDDAAAVQIEDRLYVVVEVGAAQQKELPRLLQGFLRRALTPALRRTLCVGVGPSVTDPSDVPHSRQEADDVLSLMNEQAWTGVVEASQVGAELLLYRIGAFMRSAGIENGPAILALAQHDRDKRTDYIDTLANYLRANCDTPTTAQRMHLHRNTVRYRLQRIAEISDLCLEDPDARLAAELQLRVRQAVGFGVTHVAAAPARA